MSGQISFFSLIDQSPVQDKVATLDNKGPRNHEESADVNISHVSHTNLSHLAFFRYFIPALLKLGTGTWY